MRLSVDLSGGEAAALAGSKQVHYRIAGPGIGTPIKGMVLGDPVAATGAADLLLTLDVPGGGPRLLSFQVNDAQTGAPELVGATMVDLTVAPAFPNFIVQMGSVARNCTVFNGGTTVTTAGTYSFNTDIFAGLPPTYGPLVDVAFQYVSLAGPGNVYDMREGQNATPVNNRIAYLGNGPLVDFPGVPSDDRFRPTALLAKPGWLQRNDVFCVRLASIPGAHAWVQVVNNPVAFTPGGGPVLRYRVSTLPYYSYFRTTADTLGTCNPGW
jgi:hypothetical protein